MDAIAQTCAMYVLRLVRARAARSAVTSISVVSEYDVGTRVQ